VLNKLEKAKVLHLYEHYRLNAKNALENGNVELAREYEIRLDTMNIILSQLGLKAWNSN